jgi:[ribosomal protein S5]-alanine N-acetyltransferase
MEIKTDALILRKWKIEDAEQLTLIANNKKIYDNLRDAFPHPYFLEDANKYISFAQIENKLSMLFAIEIDGKVMGSIGAFFKEDVYRENVEIGYYLAEECWGKGLMTKAIKALVEYLFNKFDINRVFAEPFARNIGSRKALEKAGFRLEAELKSNIIKNGVIENSCIYSVLKHDFMH